MPSAWGCRQVFCGRNHLSVKSFCTVVSINIDAPPRSFTAYIRDETKTDGYIEKRARAENTKKMTNEALSW